jgi:hypothetical protein
MLVTFALDTISLVKSTQTTYVWTLSRAASPASATTTEGSSVEVNHTITANAAGSTANSLTVKFQLNITGFTDPNVVHISYDYGDTGVWTDVPEFTSNMTESPFSQEYEMTIPYVASAAKLQFKLQFEVAILFVTDVPMTPIDVGSVVSITPVSYINASAGLTDTTIVGSQTLNVATGASNQSFTNNTTSTITPTVCGGVTPVDYTASLTAGVTTISRKNTVSVTTTCAPTYGLSINSASAKSTTSTSWTVTRTATPSTSSIAQGGSVSIDHSAVITASTSAAVYSDANASVSVSYYGGDGNAPSVSSILQYSYDNDNWYNHGAVTGYLNSATIVSVALSNYSGQDNVYIKWLPSTPTVSASVAVTSVYVDPSVVFSDTYIPSVALSSSQTLSATEIYSSVICGAVSLHYTALLTKNSSTTVLATASAQVDLTVVCPGCIREKTYWKSHPEDPSWSTLPQGKDTMFFSSGVSYFDILSVAPSRNAYYILAHEYVTALMNLASGAPMPSFVKDTLDKSTALFSFCTPSDIYGLKGNSELRKQFVVYADVLSGYNEGEEGPQVCGLTNQ